MIATIMLSRGGSHDTFIQFRLSVLPAAQRSVAPAVPVHHGRGCRGCAGDCRQRDRRRAGRDARAAAGRPILIKGGCVLSLDSAVGDFEQADVLIEGKKISAVKPNISAPNAQVIDAVEVHRHAGLRRYPPSHVAGLPAQRAAGRLARTITSQLDAAQIRREHDAGRCLCRRPTQRARLHRRRRDLGPRLVAHPEFAGAHRRLHQGTAGIRRARRCSPMAPADRERHW